MIKHLEKEENFNESIKAGMIMVDFYADWCGPCKMLASVLEEIDFIDVLKVNVDACPSVAKNFGIMSIPTLIFFKDGIEVAREIGYHGIDELKETYKKIL